MPEPVPVRVRDCACPGTPHADGDVVYLRPTLSLEGGLRAQQGIAEAGGDTAELTRRWIMTFVRYGACGANFIEPWDVEAVLADFSIGAPVADRADELYSEAFLRPLGISRQPTSPRGPTAASTSRTRRRTP